MLKKLTGSGVAGAFAAPCDGVVTLAKGSSAQKSMEVKVLTEVLLDDTVELDSCLQWKVSKVSNLSMAWSMRRVEAIRTRYAEHKHLHLFGCRSTCLEYLVRVSLETSLCCRFRCFATIAPKSLSCSLLRTPPVPIANSQCNVWRRPNVVLGW